MFEVLSTLTTESLSLMACRIGLLKKQSCTRMSNWGKRKAGLRVPKRWMLYNHLQTTLCRLSCENVLSSITSSGLVAKDRFVTWTIFQNLLSHLILFHLLLTSVCGVGEIASAYSATASAWACQFKGKEEEVAPKPILTVTPRLSRTAATKSRFCVLLAMKQSMLKHFWNGS